MPGPSGISVMRGGGALVEIRSNNPGLTKFTVGAMQNTPSSPAGMLLHSTSQTSNYSTFTDPHIPVMGKVFKLFSAIGGQHPFLMRYACCPRRYNPRSANPSILAIRTDSGEAGGALEGLVNFGDHLPKYGPESPTTFVERLDVFAVLAAAMFSARKLPPYHRMHVTLTSRSLATRANNATPRQRVACAWATRLT
ncbi:hypothetical protein BS47DRAFT_1357847 [Hydnum rufescens UP504]|uniref:Uncharacterized protein n=1 Tax=Hydnum rufescens UP504 TaxID=1448309 RepID=A0A9P6DYT1_9AGAM|nr:hypothetical protein BS47DRAFT_1357847 [Hydnum rufescens UP504]